MVVTNKVKSGEDTSVVCGSVLVVDCIVSLFVDVAVVMWCCICSFSEVVLGRESVEVVVERGPDDVVEVGSSLPSWE